MDVLLIFLIPILFIASIIIGLLPRNSGHGFRSFFITLSLPLLILFFDEIIGRLSLKLICELNPAIEYAKTVQTLGYFDVDNRYGCGLSCLDRLVYKKFSYYETNITVDYPYHADELGIYKYYLADIGSALCAGGKEIPREKNILPKNKCIASVKQDSISSNYEVSMIKSTKIYPWPFNIRKTLSYVKNRNTNNIIAKATSFSYLGGWLKNYSFFYKGSGTCHPFETSHGKIHNFVITSKTPNK